MRRSPAFHDDASPLKAGGTRGLWTGSLKAPTLGTILAHLALLLGVVIMFLPVLWIVLSSFKPLSEIYLIPPSFLPHRWIISNYEEALRRFPFLTYLLNSVAVTVGATLLTLVINSMAAFVLSKYAFRGPD